MGRTTINFASIGLVPPGEYLVEVERVLQREKIDGSNEYLLWELRVVDRDERLEMISSLRPNMLPMLQRTLAALGVEQQAIDFVDESDGYDRVVVEPDFTGKQALACVDHRRVGDQTYVRVRSLRAPDA